MATQQQMNTSKKVQTCLDFIDQKLESSSEQTIQIAELIIEDIKSLTQAYPQALQDGSLKEHAELVRQTQLNWVNRLHEIILEQTNRDLSGQVIVSLQKFANRLNHKQLEHIDFEIPSAVAKDQAHDELEYLNQDEIEILMGQRSLFDNATRH